MPFRNICTATMTSSMPISRSTAIDPFSFNIREIAGADSNTAAVITHAMSKAATQRDSVD